MINKILQQQICENIADYTDTQVPVTVELVSITPGPGDNQTFCYTVTQEDEPIALSHWLLGICPTITLEDIVEVTVTINGEPQTVITDPDDPDVNVEIRTVDNPDPTTGCIGLKFDFGLEEAGDVMTVCFELTTTYPIGPNVVCIKGGQVTENALSVCGPVCEEIEECEVTVFQNIGVCVPVTITPSAEVGPVNVSCCGPAIVSTIPCPIGAPPSCTFYVRQNICAEVPVIISAEGDSGETVVSCGDLSQEGCICNG